MKKSESFRSKYKLSIIYLTLMILFWVWQVLDWRVIRAWNDPIRHVLFYLVFMPFVSFIFWVIVWDTHKWRIFPIYALIITLFVFLFFANWGLRIGMNCESLLWYGFIYIICPSFWAAIIWVILARIAILLWHLFKHKK